MRADRQRDDEQEVHATQRRIRRKRSENRSADRSEHGASTVEYALLIALIVIVCIVSITYFGTSVGGRFSNTASMIDITSGP